MKRMKTQRIPDEGTGERSHVGRRRFLGGVGAGGLATAATVFGFAPPASATVKYACCNLCCTPNTGHTLAQCESGTYYVWTCYYNSNKCYCCEHRHPCSNGCNYNHYSVYRCA